MKCDEAQALEGAYLDSELDAAKTLEVGRHLESCPECARIFAEEEELYSLLKTTLSKGQRSGDLWEKAEGTVASAARRRVGSKTTAPDIRKRNGLLPHLRSLVAVLGRVRWTPARLAWTGLGAAWLAILVLNASGRGTAAPMLAQSSPSSAALRFAVMQRHQLMAELSFGPEQPSAAPVQTPASSKRSASEPRTINT